MPNIAHIIDHNRKQEEIKRDRGRPRLYIEDDNREVPGRTPPPGHPEYDPDNDPDRGVMHLNRLVIGEQKYFS